MFPLKMNGHMEPILPTYGPALLAQVCSGGLHHESSWGFPSLGIDQAKGIDLNS